jgi:hypothetical protein
VGPLALGAVLAALAVLTTERGQRVALGDSMAAAVLAVVAGEMQLVTAVTVRRAH